MTTLYKIEKGIKLTKPMKSTGGLPSKTALTMKEMAKGDSFLVSDELDAMKAEKVVRDHNGRERERGGNKQFVTRRTDKGLRIWRIK